MIKTKKQSFIIVGAFVLILMLFTTTYAFFNYTRTGSANTIRTGRISFNHTQGTAINLTDMFPIDVTNGIPNDNTKVGTLTINVTGDTTYTEGLEYLVTATDVSNTVGSGNNAKSLPISISVTVEDNDNNDPATSLGTSSSDYFNDRGGDTSYYSVVAGDTIEDDGNLLMGYIAPGADGVDGNIVIKAYIDEAKVGISDTYPAESTDSNSDGYIDGTPSSFGENKTIFTTTEWNSLQQNGVSFKVKVESKEGTWIEEPVVIPTIASCLGCKFIFTENDYYYTANNSSQEPISTLTTFANNNDTLHDDYRDVVAGSGKNYFLGFKFDGNENVTNAYVCGIKGEEPNNGVPFCVESSTDASTYAANTTFVNDNTTGIWQGMCTSYNDQLYCDGLVTLSIYTDGSLDVYDNNGNCFASNEGYVHCG